MTDGDSEDLHAEEPVAKKKLISVIAPALPVPRMTDEELDEYFLKYACP